jgi:hypothetical protein
VPSCRLIPLKQAAGEFWSKGSTQASLSAIEGETVNQFMLVALLPGLNSTKLLMHLKREMFLYRLLRVWLRLADGSYRIDLTLAAFRRAVRRRSARRNQRDFLGGLS